MSLPTSRRSRAPVLLILLPLAWMGPALGPHKVTGLPTGMLFGQLSAGLDLRGGLNGGDWSWPENLVLSVLQLSLGGWLGDGLVVGLGVLLGTMGVGLGAWSLVRRLGGSPTTALCLALLLQLSPPLIRATRSGELGWLALGPCLWALSRAMDTGARPLGTCLVALLAGGWSPVGALLMGIAGLRYRWLLVGLLPLFPALLVDPAEFLGALRLAPSPSLAPSAVVGENLALFPTGAQEISPAEGSWSLGRLPGGLGIWGLGVLGMVTGRRGWAALGLALLGAWIAVFGVLPAQGAPPPVPAPWLESLAGSIPGLRPPVGSLAWLILAVPPLLFAVSTQKAAPWLLSLAAPALFLEGAGPGVPVTQLGPDPALAVLADLPEGSVSVFPDSQSAGRTSHRSPEELHYRLGVWGRQSAGGQDGLLQAHLAHQSGSTIPLDWAEEIWSERHVDPIQWGQDRGVVAVVVDRRIMSAESQEILDAWLVSRVGMALAESPDWKVYRARTLEGS